MIDISYEQAQKMYQNLLTESMRNIRVQEARVADIITVEEHSKIIEQSDADMLFLESVYRCLFYKNPPFSNGGFCFLK